MRRYFQGTLDFACGIYAVINALVCTHGIDLAEARRLFQEAQLALASVPELFAKYVRNETDHYWLVRFMLSHIRQWPRYRLEFFQPFSGCLLPSALEDELSVDSVALFLPEEHPPKGPAPLKAASLEAQAVWKALTVWFAEPGVLFEKRAAIFRFHRFLPGVPGPVVSHWTTGRALLADTLLLHDASSEPGAIFEIDRQFLLPSGGAHSLLRIVPESLLLLRTVS